MYSLLPENRRILILFMVLFTGVLYLSWFAIITSLSHASLQIFDYLSVFLLFSLIIISVNSALNHFIIPIVDSYIFGKTIGWEETLFYVEPVSTDKISNLIDALRMPERFFMENKEIPFIEMFSKASFELVNNHHFEGQKEPEMPPLFIPGDTSINHGADEKRTGRKPETAIENWGSDKQRNPYVTLARQLCIAQEVRNKTIFYAARKSTRKALNNHIFKKPPSVLAEIHKLHKRTIH